MCVCVRLTAGTNTNRPESAVLSFYNSLALANTNRHKGGRERKRERRPSEGGEGETLQGERKKDKEKREKGNI